MAKGRIKKRRTDKKPDALDAINIAALRYYAMSIERLCLSIYIGDDEQHTNYEELLKDLGGFLKATRKKYGQKKQYKAKRLSAFEADCRDDWVLCNSFCVPPDEC